MARSLVSGVASAMAGLVAFLVIHHVWIAPIWFITPMGVATAAVGGLSVGWSYEHVQKGLPAGQLRALALFGLALAMLLPGMLLSFTHGPLFDLRTGAVTKGQGAAVALRFAFELVLPAVIVGALAGYRLGRSARAAFSTAVAAVAWSFGPGHNIPMFGTEHAAFKGHVIVLLVVLVSSVTLTVTAAYLEKRRQDRAPSGG